MILKTPNLRGDYLFTIKYCDKYFSIRYLYGLAFYYVNETADLTYNFALAARKEDLSDDCIFDGNNRFKKRMKKCITIIWFDFQAIRLEKLSLSLSNKNYPRREKTGVI